MIREAVLILALMLGACGQSPEEMAREDEAAVAAVKAAQNRIPPPSALSPEQFGPDDFARMDDHGASCAFYLGSVPDARAVLMARPSYGWIKLEGDLLKLVSDSGSDAGPLGTWTRYAGKDISIRIEHKRADRVASEAPRQEAPAQLMVRDRWDRVVFAAAGSLRCAAQ